ncbi:UDP-glycosyltransferase 79B2-like [Quercus lobata]|uniref:UDP-glycosyltransferase 79B2-like n=1 Tax=Quercus lobata TaxID=97700 RepID=UPI001249108D|nr:UDP-glycosyltransferase 79B2-like [Quercus lobata]
MSLYVQITYGLIQNDALAYRTYHEFEGPYCDYLRQHYAKPVLLTGLVLLEAPATKLDEKWTNWLCNFKQDGCATIEEAFPEGFEERVKGRGWVYGGWVPQTLILEHPSIGCSVTHCGYGSMWESLFSDCQIVCVSYLGDQIVGARLMVEELKVAVEVEREDNGRISKESLSKAIISVMDEDSEIAGLVKYNHAKLKEELTSEGMQERYLDTFIQNLQGLKD